VNIYGYKQITAGQKYVFNRARKPFSDGPGCSSLLSHLKASGNISERSELDGGRVVTLYRPLDFNYAKSWVGNTRYLLDCERPSILAALAQAERDRTIWLSFE
jgi:hypothetical protein